LIFNTLPFGVVVYLSITGWRTRSGVIEARAGVQVSPAEQLTTARLAALQSQLNPHFNSLNTIAVSRATRTTPRHA
jgi:hypothetical protein